MEGEHSDKIRILCVEKGRELAAQVRKIFDEERIEVQKVSIPSNKSQIANSLVLQISHHIYKAFDEILHVRDYLRSSSETFECPLFCWFGKL
jgi:hypothetical protein